MSLPIKDKIEKEVKPIVNPHVVASDFKKDVEQNKTLIIREPKKVVKDVTYFMQVDDSYIPLEEKVVSARKKHYLKKQKKLSKVEKLPKAEKQPVLQPSNNPLYEDISTHKKSTKERYEEKKKILNMSVKSMVSVEDMEKMYKKEKKYALALKIGQKYYDQHKYSKALFWSKEANLLDHKAEGAWILYAKSEYAKGNKKRAIKILNLYRGNTNSPEADSLVMKWMERSKK
jgi:predicted small secreted protein